MQNKAYQGQQHINTLRRTAVGVLIGWLMKQRTWFRAMLVPLLLSISCAVACFVLLRATLFGLVPQIVSFPVVFVLWIAGLALAVFTDLIKKEWKNQHD